MANYRNNEKPKFIYCYVTGLIDYVNRKSSQMTINITWASVFVPIC